MVEYIKRAVGSRRLIAYLTWGRIKQGERNLWFGRLWNLLDPLGLLVIYYLIFNVIFSSRLEHFAIFLFSAIIAFRFFAQTTLSCSEVIVGHRGLVRKAYFPRAVLPISVVIQGAHDYAYGLVTLLLIAAVSGVPFSPWLLLWPLIFAVEFILTLGVGLITANLGVFFRDLKNILGLLFRLVFYMSGTMYDITRIPPAYREYFRMNPIYVFYESYRNILLYDRPPSWLHLLGVAVLSLLLLGAGLYWMSKQEGQYAKYV